MKSIVSAMVLHLAGLGLLPCAGAEAAGGPAVLGVECEDFQFAGSWTPSGTLGDSSGRSFLFAGPAAEYPAATAVEIPRAGRYVLWARSYDYPDDRPGQRTFEVRVGNQPNSAPFARHGKDGWHWERGDAFDLPAGPVLLTLHDSGSVHFGRADALVLASDPKFVPHGTLAKSKVSILNPLDIRGGGVNPMTPISPVRDDPAGTPLGTLENEHLRIRFLPAVRRGMPSARPALDIRGGSDWIPAPLDPSAESYQILSAAQDTALQITGFYPRWSHSPRHTIEVEAGGASVRTLVTAHNAIWGAGYSVEAIAHRVTQETPGRLRLDFHPTTSGTLVAHWTLPAGSKTVKIDMAFSPLSAGQYSLGYFLFQRKPLEEVEELLLPMMVQRKRFPRFAYTLLQAMCPTPVSMMQTPDAKGSITWAISVDPSEIPLEFPVPIRSRFGLHIRNADGLVQPSIYGPLIGHPDARVAADGTARFAFRIHVESGDWYQAYRTSADEVFGLTDYRTNASASLTDAVLNMIDLYMDDEYGGWWTRAKAPYQIESKNSSTHASPMTAVSLYRLTGNADLYRRRALPTLEFMLSRSGAHFSPDPEDSGGIPVGSMRGPVGLYGTPTFGGLDEMLNHRTSVFRRIALPEVGIRPTGGYTHSQPFEDWLARHQFTGEPDALREAVRMADDYIRDHIVRPPDKELGPTPFFLISYTPAWEGLLNMYEATGERRFLDAAVFGARQVMTGMWTQPTPQQDDIVIHPGGFCHGDKMHWQAHKGPESFRLGWPRREGDTPERSIPQWIVSNTGLGFEQPTTYVFRDNGGRMIFQAPWAPAFLRLARHTGDRLFETYARNAVVGRWGNYPGYYITTFTDLVQNPRYPYEGPDMGFFYYHHLPVHLSWSIDYLVCEAALLSANAVRFPGSRQYGYAFFDNLVYGHAPGEIFGETGAWLWLRRGLVRLDNPQINHLTAHNGGTFFVVLTNQSFRDERVKIAFNPRVLATGNPAPARVRILKDGGDLPLIDHVCETTVPARGLVALAVDGLAIDVPAHRIHPEPQPSAHPDFLTATADGVEIRAAAIQIEPGPWQAYAWSTAGSQSLRGLRIDWTLGEETRTSVVTSYPYEISIPVPAGIPAVRLDISGVQSNGTPFRIGEQILGVGR